MKNKTYTEENVEKYSKLKMKEFSGGRKGDKYILVVDGVETLYNTADAALDALAEVSEHNHLKKESRKEEIKRLVKNFK